MKKIKYSAKFDKVFFSTWIKLFDVCTFLDNIDGFVYFSEQMFSRADGLRVVVIHCAAARLGRGRDSRPLGVVCVETGLRRNVMMRSSHYNNSSRTRTLVRRLIKLSSPTSSFRWLSFLRLTPSQRMRLYSARERNTSITQVSSQISSAVTELDTGILDLRNVMIGLYEQQRDVNIPKWKILVFWMLDKNQLLNIIWMSGLHFMKVIDKVDYLSRKCHWIKDHMSRYQYKV